MKLGERLRESAQVLKSRILSVNNLFSLKTRGKVEPLAPKETTKMKCATAKCVSSEPRSTAATAAAGAVGAATTHVVSMTATLDRKQPRGSRVSKYRATEE